MRIESQETRLLQWLSWSEEGWELLSMMSSFCSPNCQKERIHKEILAPLQLWPPLVFLAKPKPLVCLQQVVNKESLFRFVSFCSAQLESVSKLKLKLRRKALKGAVVEWKKSATNQRWATCCRAAQFTAAKASRSARACFAPQLDLV